MFLPQELSYYIISLGCPKNEVDAERLNADLHNAGFVPAHGMDDASIIFINTCGFIKEAKEESIAAIMDAMDYKAGEHDYKKKLVVLGCLTQRYKEEITHEIPEIDLVWGLYDSSMINEVARICTVDLLTVTIAQKRKPLVDNVPYSYIKIAEGCSNNCSYCAIPIIRGKHRSYAPELIADDAAHALQRGVKELIVVAQDVAIYNYDGVFVNDLISRLNNLEGTFWIRLMYCHPDHISSELIEAMATLQKVVHYIDIPFQHASTKILRAMNRKGNAKRYLRLVEKLRKAIPDIAIRSTFMVGFPGEDDDDYAVLLDFITEAQLDRVGVFMYSPEEGTKASVMSGMVKKAIQHKRYNRLMQLQQTISLQRLEKTIGNVVEVLVEEKVDANNYIGRTQYDAPDIDGIFFLTADGINVNDIVLAKITDTLEYDRIGVLI